MRLNDDFDQESLTVFKSTPVICKAHDNFYLIGLVETLQSNHLSLHPVPKLIMESVNTFSSISTDLYNDEVVHDITNGIDGFDEPKTMTRSASSADCFSYGSHAYSLLTDSKLLSCL